MRHFAPLLVLAGSSLLLACSSSEGSSAGPGGNAGGAGGAAGGSGGGAGSSGAAGAPPVRPTDEAAATARAACEFQAGAVPAETLGASDPIGSSIPVNHVLIMMMENRSFDHYFSQLPAYGQTDVTVADASFTNPDLTGAQVAWHPAERYCVEDPDHGWRGSHEQFAGGQNSGFVTTNEPDGRRAMGWFGPSDIPFYYELADTFAISDRYFCSLLGPTWPNRMYLYSGSSHGLTRNTLPSAGDTANIFQALTDAGIEWKVYRSNLAPVAMFISTLLESTAGCSNPDSGLPCRVVDIDQIFVDLAAGTIPPVAFIDPEYSTGITETSEHPPANPHHGQHLSWQVVDALTRSPVWSSSALFLTYDEHGGFADHVPPPAACDPGTGAPEDGGSDTFDRFGFRVPLFVVSPFAKAHHVSHVDRDHTSVLRFVQARFGIAAFSNRDANAASMTDLFDFENPPFATPPVFTEPPIDAARLAECDQDFPGGG